MWETGCAVAKDSGIIIVNEEVTDDVDELEMHGKFQVQFRALEAKVPLSQEQCDAVVVQLTDAAKETSEF